MCTWLCLIFMMPVLVLGKDPAPVPPLRVMTFNIRYGTANDGPNHWEKRKEDVRQVLVKNQPDIVGLQEALRFQIDFLVSVCPQYRELGVGRDDGKTKGEYSAILYRSDRFKPIESGTFWLSDTPTVPGSITWGNACTRICTWAQLQDRATQRRLAVYNTHWDHVSQPSRLKNAALIIQHIQSKSAPHGILLLGDFNAAEDNPALQPLREAKFNILSQDPKETKPVQLVDTFRVLHPDVQEVRTGHGFKGTRSGGKIDYIWASENFTVLEAAIVHDQKDGRYPSDHFPVTAVLALRLDSNVISEDDIVTYEAFGAVGDGVNDDLPAICKAHAYANAHGLSVKTKPDATYHLGGKSLTAIIATDTDWNTSRFTIDDTEVEDHKKSLFEVRSLLEPEVLRIDRLTRDQQKLDVRPQHDCHVVVTYDKKKRFIRRGLNQNSGVSQRDCFILRRDGSVEGAIDWDYDNVSRVEARPMDEKTLALRGGVFTTFANRMKQEVGYNYWSRNIKISRSNTEVDGLTHYVVGETSLGHPYSGFISISNCAHITLRNCFATGHKIYSTIGAAGKPVSMGSYDYSADNVVNFSMINCRMNHINDRTRWGVIGTNFCKNILLEDCTLSRMDTHMGVSGTYVIRRCTLGYMGLNAIGRGLLTVEDSTLYGSSLINFRSDYGSTWEGDVVIRNCRWIPASGKTFWPHMISTQNDGLHDFGYTCFMPREITIDGLFVDDSNHPKDYQGMYFFSDPDGGKDIKPTNRPFPFERCQKLRVRGLTTASGKRPRVSSNAQIEKSIVLIEDEE